jgi:hypothetical protein
MNPWTLSGDLFLCFVYFHHIFPAFGHLIVSQPAKNRTFIIHP